ncbi:response regulator, partial [Escherichia coli]|uniref:response regulator transcription factor n=1 Tax=Escherichia coli TaxID=562 RepID=UPI002739AF98
EVLSRVDGINIVAEATNAAEAISLFQSARPDTVLVDVELGREQGFDVVRQIRERDPACFIIAVSSYRDAVYERMSYELGA